MTFILSSGLLTIFLVMILLLVITLLLRSIKAYRSDKICTKVLEDAGKFFLSAGDVESACQLTLGTVQALFSDRKASVQISIATEATEEMVVITSSGSLVNQAVEQKSFGPDPTKQNYRDKSRTNPGKSNSLTSIAIPLKVAGLSKGTILVESSAKAISKFTGALMFLGATLSMALENLELKKKVSKEQEKNRKLIEDASDIIFLTDANGQFEYVNKAASEITGYACEELMGLHFLKLIREDWREPADIFYKQQIKEMALTAYYEFPMITKDGREIWIGQNARPIIEKGSLQGFKAIARDITLQKKAEEAILTSKEYYNLFNLANDSILIFEPEEEIVLDANDKALMVYGFSKETFIGKSLKDLSEDVSRGKEHIQKLLLDKTYQEFETVQFCQDGTPVNFLINSSVIEYKGRQAVLSINRDITDRKRIEDAQRESESAFRSLAETLSIGIVIHDQEQGLYMNSAIETLTGYGKTEWLSKQMWDFLPADHKELVDSYIFYSKNNASFPRRDFLCQMKSGKDRWVDISASPIIYKGTQAVMVTIVDISERKLAEEKLRSSEEGVSKIFRLSPYPKAILSLDNQQYIDVNESLLVMTGYEREEIIGRTPTELNMWVDSHERDQVWQTIKEQGRLHNVEIRLRTKSGDVRDNLVSAEVIELHGQKCLLCVSNDISERIRMEEALRDAELCYHKLFEQSPEGIVIIDPETTSIVEFNPAACQQLGYLPIEFAKLGMLDIEADKTPSDLAQCVQQLQDKGELTYETLHRTKLGESRNVLVISRLIELTGKIFCFSIFRDITESKRADAKLRASEAQLNEAQRIAHIGSWELDLINNILIWSDENFRIYEIDPGTFGATYEAFLDLVHPDDREKLEMDFSNSIHNHTDSNIVHRAILPDGRIKFIQGYCKIFYDDKGNPVRSVGTVQDITDRKVTEEAILMLNQDLQRRIAEMETLLNVLPIGIGISNDPQCLDIRVNPAFARLLAVHPEGNASLSAEPDQRPDTFKVYQQGHELAPEELPMQVAAAQGIEVHDFEEVIVRQNGTTTDLLCYAAPLFDPQGAIRGSVGVFVDITERKQAEEAIGRSQAQLEAVFQAIQDGIVVTDMEGNFLLVNDAEARIFGYPSAEDMKKNLTYFAEVFELSYLDGQKVLIEEWPLSKILRGESIAEWELRGRRLDTGQEWFFSYSGEPVYDEHGKQILAVVVTRDITERKKAEEGQTRLQAMVKEAAIEWRNTFDALETPIILLDLEGRIVRANDPVRVLAGRNHEDIIGLKISSFAQREPWRKADEMVIEMRTGYSPVSYQTSDEINGKSWELSATSFNSSTGESDDDRIILVARDITSMIELQESLRKGEMVSAMGRLVAGVAHEVRNPLFAISAAIDDFVDAYGEQTGFGLYATKLQEEVERLNSLMKDLLDYGKPISLHITSTSIDQVISEALSMCELLGKEKQVALLPSLGLNVSPIDMDRSRMVLAIRNLLENAIQHSAKSSTVIITTRQIEKDEKRWVECMVKDSGTGFDEKDIEKAFDPFFTRRRKGTGLGLAIVRRIIDDHGGEIVINNRPEGGAAVIFRLPYTGNSCKECS